MARYIIQDEGTKGVKTAFKKYGALRVENDKVIGAIRFIGYRKYSWGEQVDIEFIGQIKARTGLKLEWMSSSVMDDKSRKVSKVKVNRFIKRCCFTDIKRHLGYFGVKIDDYSKITKVKWI